MEIALVIPSFEPKGTVVPLVKELADSHEFSPLIVVDDGSGESYQPLFDELRKMQGVTVLSYPKNHGKGFALKLGFWEVSLHHLEVDYIMTADSDFQHLPADIVRLAEVAKQGKEALYLGSRNFTLPGVPSHNKAGNNFSSFYFKIATKKKIGDTQTGLRAIPKSLFDLAENTDGDRYDYEMNFLLAAAKVETIREIPIETV